MQSPWEHTLIVYASDHGEMLGDHGRWGKGLWYESSVRVPLIMNGPGVRQGVLSDALVSLHDVTATLVDYCGLDAPPGMDAISLRPALQDGVTDHRDSVLCGLDDWRMIVSGHHKLVLRDGHEPLLYDLQADPWEDTSIAEQQPGVVCRLRNVLVERTGWTGG